MPPDSEVPREENSSKTFHQKLMEKWREDPVNFVDDLNNFVDPFDRMGRFEVYVSEAIGSGGIRAEDFDDACLQWLETIDIVKIKEDFEARQSSFPLAYRLRDVLFMTMPDRKGVTKFPKAAQWFKDNKDKLLSITIADDGGHWENGVKRVLKEFPS